jgi:predicted Fe-Mo cluster-binding NifX family protein
MKILFTSTGETWESEMDSRFGRAEYLVLFDEESNVLTSTDNSAVKDEAHGAGTATAQKVYELKPDVLITGNGPGENAATALKHLQMKIFINAHNLSLKEAYNKYREGKLTEL